MSRISGQYCIVGLGDAPSGASGIADYWEHAVVTAAAAIKDAGLTKDDIDCVITSGSMVEKHPRHQVVLCEQLGIERSKFTELSAMGGSAPTSNLRHAVAAIHSGMATCALVIGTDNLLSARGRQGAIEAGPGEFHNAQFEIPYGPYMVTLYALISRRWMHDYGWTSEQLAAVPVAMRAHASMHPDAMISSPALDVSDVLESRMICSPFRLLDCSVFADGGGAYVVTSAERAADLPHPPIYVLGVGGAYSYYYFEKWPDLVKTPRSIIASAADEAFDMAGVDRADVDVVGIADMFSATVPIALESAGFCDEGEGAAFCQDGRIERTGALPVNTHGGNLSFGLPGVGAQFPHFIEVCRQLRGEAGLRQLSAPSLGYVHNWSGNFSQQGAALLSNRRS